MKILDCQTIDKSIRILFYGPNLAPIELERKVDDIKFIEQLLFQILEEHNVGPVYRYLFAFRLSNTSLWLPPNFKIHDLLKIGRNKPAKRIIELRMRFRPSCFYKLKEHDEAAFDLIFAQLRHDFIYTKFNDEKRDFVLSDDAVIGLITSDLLRFAMENNLNVDELFERVKGNDFVPHKASRWQRTLLFHIKDKLQIRKAIELGLKDCVPQDGVSKMKISFIEVFLKEVSKDYGSESYKVSSADNINCVKPMELRLRYEQNSEDAFCYIEARWRSKGSGKNKHKWETICDIYSICYGTLRNNCVEINRLNGRPFRVEFETRLQAESFLSLVDGYYRLMRKWHFNFCKDVSSPDLDYLRSIKSHGPIGSEIARYRLLENQRPCTFLVRRCMESNHKYVIDVYLNTYSRIVISVDWDPIERVFRKSDYHSNDGNNYDIRTDQAEYCSLKNLINDIHIIPANQSPHEIPLQLRHWLPPSEYGDYLPLLLSIAKSKLAELINRIENKLQKTIEELPRLLPPEMLKFSNKPPVRAGNNFEVKFANLGCDQEVVVKTYVNENLPAGKFMSINSYCKNGTSFGRNPKTAQLRVSNWIFVKAPMFAETLGLEIDQYSIVQEYFPLGPLDRFLAVEADISEMTKRVISCQFANALLYLQDKRIIHGKIRCHNAFVYAHNPFQIKITDPLGVINLEEDLPFIAPEHLGFHHISDYESGLDIWALGTTIWQIYSQGKRPPRDRHGNELTQPNNCPDQIWSIVESCWQTDVTSRISPQVVHRDLNDAVAWCGNSHNYDYISTVVSCMDSLDNDIEPSTDSNSSITFRYDSMGESSTFNNSLNQSTTYIGSEIHLVQRRHSFAKSDTHSGGLEDRRSFDLPYRNSSRNSLKKSNRGWQSVMIFKNNFKIMGWKTTSNNQTRYDFNGSRFNISESSTPSEATKLTDLPEFGSITSAIDHCLWYVDLNRLKLGAEIGRGTCGVVLRGVLSQIDGSGEQVVAVKCIDKTNQENYFLHEDLKREFDILKNLDHKNIVKTFGFANQTQMMIIMEHMPMGSLLSRLKNSQLDNLHNLPLRKYATDIARGMEYLESMKIVHRDLALRNILVKSQQEVKICDFGLAQFLGESNYYELKTDRALPLKWYSPEALSTRTFTHKSDVWSYGIVLWEIYSGGSSPQYSGLISDLSETLKHERLKKPKACPADMYKLMLKCWAYYPRDRYSFGQICDKLTNPSNGAIGQSSRDNE